MFSCDAVGSPQGGISYEWETLPVSAKLKGDKLTITQYEAPGGFELAPQIPRYFAVFCWKKKH